MSQSEKEHVTWKRWGTDWTGLECVNMPDRPIWGEKNVKWAEQWNFLSPEAKKVYIFVKVKKKNNHMITDWWHRQHGKCTSLHYIATFYAGKKI